MTSHIKTFLASPEMEAQVAKAICSARFPKTVNDEYYSDPGWRGVLHREAKEILDAIRKTLSAQTFPNHEQEGEPDWWYCDADPEENGDSAYEAMFQHRERLVPNLLHTSFHGPQKWGVLAPSVDDDGEEAHVFDTEEEAQAFCHERKPNEAKASGAAS